MVRRFKQLNLVTGTNTKDNRVTPKKKKKSQVELSQDRSCDTDQ